MNFKKYKTVIIIALFGIGIYFIFFAKLGTDETRTLFDKLNLKASSGTIA